MASYDRWLNENGALLDYSDTANAPSKDFYHIFLTPREMVYRMWKIIPPTRPDNHPQPSQVRDTWAELKDDERLQSEIQRVAGERTVEYIINIVKGKLDYLHRLPENVLLKLIMMLDLETIAQLSMTCRKFRELCKCNELWEKIYKMHNKQPITQELLILVEQRGWREVFFTNKLQLQVQMRRIATSNKGNAAFVTQEQSMQY